MALAPMPMAGGGGGPMPKPGAGPGPLGMPKSPIGGPSGGPGGGPMVSPGGGAGNLASAISQIKTVHTALTKHLNAFPAGSKEQQAVFRALQALNTVIKDAPPENSKAAVQSMLHGGASAGGPLAGTPPGGVASPPLSPTNPGAGIPSLAGLGGEAMM